MAAVVKQDNIKPRQRPLEPIVSSEKGHDVPKERVCGIVQGHVNPALKAMPYQVIAELIDSIRVLEHERSSPHPKCSTPAVGLGT